MPLIQGKSKKSFSKNVETEMNAGKDQKQALAISYSVKRKNQRKAQGGLVRADAGRATADHLMLAEGGEVRAGSERPTADSGQVHECSDSCQDMTVRAHEMIRAGSVRPTADSGEGNPAGTQPTSGGADRRGGSAPVSADSGERTNAPKRTAASPGKSIRAASTRPTADNDEMGSTQMLAYGGDVEGEDEDRHMGSLAEAIADRLHSKMMAQGGMAHDDGLNENSEEHGNMEDDLSYDALGEEQFDDDQLSDQPADSNEIGDSEEKDAEDDEDGSIISKIRARSKKGK